MAQVKKILFKIGLVEGDFKLSMYLLFLAIVYPWRFAFSFTQNALCHVFLKNGPVVLENIKM